MAVAVISRYFLSLFYFSKLFIFVDLCVFGGNGICEGDSSVELRSNAAFFLSC